MDFNRTDEQQAIVETIRDLVRDKVAPRAAEIDEKAEFPDDIFDLFAEHDLLGIHIDPEYGGLTGSSLTLCMAVEEVARACATSALMIAVQALGTYPFLVAASEEQKRKWLPPLARGELKCAYGLSEPVSGSDAAGMKTTAVRKNGEYVLNGSKIFITQGDVADVVTVFARTDPDAGSRGISAFLLEKGTPGFTCGKREQKLGIKGSPTVELHFQDCRIPAANVLGSEGQGFKVALAVLDRSRPGVGAQALGIAQGALDYAVSYTKERQQFGQPIATFQGLQFMMADMATQVEAARGLVYLAASKIDQKADDVTRFAAMAKLFASDTAMRVTTDAVQLLGGYGYMKEFPVERMMRDAKITQIYEGTNQIQRVVIARQLLGRLG
ncbi:MAG: acyl-CoA dehydrogenase [Candidatus Dormibacteria bacterium]